MPGASLEGSRARETDADTRTVIVRLRQEKGFGLLELLMAMTMLNIGILALVASFNSGAIALKRAGRTATAATLADAQMELYRALKYDSIALDDTTTKTLTDTTYRSDAAIGGNVNSEVTTTTGCTASPLLNQCNPSRTISGAASPDHRTYRVDTYITSGPPTTATSPQPAARDVKTVTVVIRDGSAPYGELARQQSTFDQSTGV
jgi:Tfp pilus assembly protein PilV